MSQNNSSELLFFNLFRWLETEFDAYGFQGVWCFNYFQGSESLKTAYFKSKMQLGPTLIKEIKDTFISCNNSTIGNVLFELRNKIPTTNPFLTINNTFEDPRGVVCIVDSEINQRHALFILIIDERSKILGVIDIFFKEELTKEIQKEIEGKISKEEGIFRYFNDFAISAFSLRFYELIHQEGSAKSKKINNASYLENLLTMFSNTPVFAFVDDTNSPIKEYILINKNFFFESIINGLKLCSLFKNPCPIIIDSFGLQNNESIPSKQVNILNDCKDPFLQIFYHKIFTSSKYHIQEFECIINEYKILFKVMILNSDKEFHEKIKKNIGRFSDIQSDIKYSCDTFIKDYDISEDSLAHQKYLAEKSLELFVQELRKLSLSCVLVMQLFESKNALLGNCSKFFNDKTEIKHFGSFISPSNMGSVLASLNTEGSLTKWPPLCLSKHPEFYKGTKKTDKSNVSVIEFTIDKSKTIKLPWQRITSTDVPQPILKNVRILNEEIFIDEIKNQIMQYWSILPNVLKNRINNGSSWNKDGDFVRYIGEYPLQDGSAFAPIIHNLINTINLSITNDIAQKSQLQTSLYKFFISNTAHHLTSHCGPYCKPNKIYERLDLLIPKVSKSNEKDSDSVTNMGNLYSCYKDSRDEFVAGIDDNTQPVAMRFYKDIIQPLAENSLFLDTIAASEKIRWSKKTENGINSDISGISRLRFRVFYHCNLFGKDNWDDLPVCNNGIVKKIEKEKDKCNIGCESKNGTSEISEGIYLDENGCYREMVAHYNVFTDKYDKQTHEKKCIHNLSYFRYYVEGSFHDGNVDYTCDDIEILVRGTQGAHSVYSILENFIRNTAKHAKKEILEQIFNLDVIIKLKKIENNPASICMEITTNVPTFSEVFTRDQAKESANKNKQFAKLLLESGKGIYPTTTQRGIADMKINGVFLKMQDITQENLSDAIKLGHYPKGTSKEYAIAYNFTLKKPQKVAFVGSFKKTNNYEEEFEANGIRLFDNLSKDLYSFQFVVFSSDFFNEHIDTILGASGENKNEWLYRLPRRVIIFCENSNLGEVLSRKIEDEYKVSPKRFTLTDVNPLFDNSDKTLIACWQVWLKRWLKDKENDKIKIDVVVDEVDKKNIFSDLEDAFFKKNDCVVKQIFFHRHFAMATQSKDWLNENSFIESIEKNNKDFNLLWGCKSWKPNAEKPELPYDLAETGLLKILIFDERLIDNLSNNDFSYPPKANFPFHNASIGEKDYVDYKRDFMDVAIAANVFVVTHLNGQPIKQDNTNRKCDFIFTGNTVEIKSENKEKTEQVIADFDVLVIHRTQINKILGTNSKGNFDIFKKHFPIIYISTGGGNIADLEKEINFKVGLLSLNQLLAHFSQSISKHSFKSYIS